MKARPTEEAYAELQQAYDFYNGALFDGELPPCLITLQRSKKTMGYFSSMRFGRRDGIKTDEIALNPEYFAVVPPIEILQTMGHEMTHLWQSHFGKPSRACYHNTEWADKMEAIGLMPSNTGRPGGKRVGQFMADYMIPGGPFEQASAKLLGQGFMISWLDRFPAKPLKPQMDQVAESLPETQDEMADQLSSDVRIPEGAGYQVALPAVALVAPSETAIRSMIEPLKSENRSNRSRYTCPSCGLNVWGKPGIRVGCLDCGVPLLEP